MTQLRLKRIAILGTRGIPAAYGGFETFAEEVAIRRLLWLQKELGPGWDRVIRGYNKGVAGARKGRGRAYLADVKAWARRLMPEAMP